MSGLPVIATAIGDPAGIGPEVCVKAVASGELAGVCHPVLIGDVGVVKRAAAVSGVDLPVERIDAPDRPATRGDAIRVLDPGGFDVAACPFGKASAASGRAVLDWIRIGTELGTSGRIQGLVMGPVDSGSLKLTRTVTDIDALQPPGTFMLRMTGNLRVVPLTEHVPLTEAVEATTPENVLKVVRLLHENLVRWGLARPRIAVAGLNPHAMFEEDRRRIGPAVEAARRLGIDASGPLSPDSVFRLGLEGKYDAVVTMYHDQGQIAVKTAAFEGACTVYLGLPYVLLNVPHGSAFDIAGQGVAQHLSMLAAMRTAAGLASGSALRPPGARAAHQKRTEERA
jgi:4-hydroxy-L-threonine phosphate dehydrogenase PdxA